MTSSTNPPPSDPLAQPRVDRRLLRFPDVRRRHSLPATPGPDQP
jgi:hypothetical protein